MVPRLLGFISLLGARCASVLLSPGVVHVHSKFSPAGRNRSSNSRQQSEKICARPNLAVFFDGSMHEIGMACSWVPPPLNCESNVVLLWRIAREIAPAKQLTLLLSGVGTREDDSYFSGKGTRHRALEAYTWLSKHYAQDAGGTCPNKIFVIGASRGGLSARMLQGMINSFGLAKAGFAEQVTSLSPYGSDGDSEGAPEYSPVDSAKAFKASGNSWQGVKIAHMGLMDAVLRTLTDKVRHRHIKSLGMRLTPVVQSFAHAMALDDPRDAFETHELYVDKATEKVNQVWFLGQHRDVMGGWPLTGLSRISAGWIADNAEEDGLFLPAGWRMREDMRADYMEEAQSDTGFTAHAVQLPPPLEHMSFDITLRHAQVKNPNHCRDREDHPGHGKPVRFHKSVEDRMVANKGWVPLPYCCEGEGTAETGLYTFDNVVYVSNAHYNHWLTQPPLPRKAPWLRISFGKLAEANTTAGMPFFLKVSTWTVLGAPSRHNERKELAEDGRPVKLVTQLKDGPMKDYDGPATVLTLHGPKPATAPPPGSQDFAGMALVVPKGNKGGVATRLIIEVHQDGAAFPLLWKPLYIGKFEIGLGPDGESIPSGMIAHNISTGGTLEVHVVEMENDEQAAQAMLLGATHDNSDTSETNVPMATGGKNHYRSMAQCLWLERNSDLSFDDLCQHAPSSIFLQFPPFARHDNCGEFIRQIVHGNTTEDLSVNK